MGQVVDLDGVLRGLRRRRYLLLAAILVGLVASALFVALSPTTYLANARVVLPPSPLDAQGHEVRDIKTEVQIVRGTTVLEPTTKAVQPSIELQALQRAISVRGVSSQIIEIAAHSGSAARAAQLANAVASSYVAYADDTATAEANSTAAAYAQEVAQLNQQVQRLDQQIAGNTAALTGLGPADTRRREAVIDTLRTQQSILAQQLNMDQSRIANAQLQAQLSRQGTQVLQPALTPAHPASPKPVVDLGLGMLAGGLIGGLLALAIENSDRRLRTRQGISDALDAPVLASLTVRAIDRPDRCRAFMEHWEPSVIEAYALCQAFAHLDLGGSSGSSGVPVVSGVPNANLVLVGLAGDPDAAALALELAVYSAAAGTQTAMVFASHDSASSALRAACHAAAPDGLGPRAGLVIHGTTGNVNPDLLDGADLVVTFLAVDGGPIHVPTWDRPTRVAVVVSAGRATADGLQSVAATCAEGGATIGGAFVANPDPNDRSIGRRAALAGSPVGGLGMSVAARPSWSNRSTDPGIAASPSDAESSSASTAEPSNGAPSPATSPNAGKSANGATANGGATNATTSARRVTTVKAPATPKSAAKSRGPSKVKSPTAESQPAGQDGVGTDEARGQE